MSNSGIRYFSADKLMCLIIPGVLLIPGVHRFFDNESILNGVYLAVFSFCLCYFFVPFMIKFGHFSGLLDHPDEKRKNHQTPTPLTGGLAICSGFLITILLNFHFSAEMKSIIVASILILILGLVDDRWTLSSRVRILVQIAVAFVVIASGVRITFIPDWLGGVYTETAITLLWIVGIMNSMNFIDGMDGLASGTCIIYSIFFAIVAIATGQDYMMFLAAAIAGSCAGFFPYNFRKKGRALIFLGDSGSTFLGFLLACFAILGEWGTSILDITIPVLIMSLLIFDMCLTTIVRVHSGEVRSIKEWLHYTGRDHIHHRLAGLGFGEKKSAWLFFSISICFGIEALAVLAANPLTSAIVLLHSTVVFILIGVILVGKNITRSDLMQADKNSSNGPVLED